MQRHQDDVILVIAAVGIAFLLTILNAGEPVLQATATPVMALFFLFRVMLRNASALCDLVGHPPPRHQDTY